jgi:hypothetical protein
MKRQLITTHLSSQNNQAARGKVTRTQTNALTGIRNRDLTVKILRMYIILHTWWLLSEHFWRSLSLREVAPSLVQMVPATIEFHRLSKARFFLHPLRSIPVVSMAISLLFGCVQKLADYISWRPPADWPTRAEKTRDKRQTLWTLPWKCKTSSRQSPPQKQRRSQRTEKWIINECGRSYTKPREYRTHVGLHVASTG